MSDNNDQQEPELQQLINENQARLQKRLLSELVAVQNRVYSDMGRMDMGRMDMHFLKRVVC